MPRPVTLFTGQWADLPLETMCEKAASFGYDGLELACWGDHFNVQQALDEKNYCTQKWQLLADHGLCCYAISNHLVGQTVCDRIDERHRSILPDHVWGEGPSKGDPEEVRGRAAREMQDTARAARKFFDIGREQGIKGPGDQKSLDPSIPHASMPFPVVVNGFTGSSIWHLLYSFPPVNPGTIKEGFADFARRWKPILDVFDEHDVFFALEVHPTEIAFDITSTRRAIEAINGHPRLCFNYDPSHFAYQGVDYLRFVREFRERIVHMHVKDVWWSDEPKAAGVFGGHTDFGHPDRFWDFRSPGRGRIDFEAIIRELNHIGYRGPLSVEWEDPMMDREHGAAEAAEFVRMLDFPMSQQQFDAAFEKR